MSNPTRVYTKARKQFGVVYAPEATDYSVKVNPQRIAIYKDDSNGIPVLRREIEIGDKAEYDSYNLSYIGEVVKITNKCVTIVAYKGHSGMERVHRLDLNTFCYRNWDFNLNEATARNSDAMMYL